MKGAMGGLVKEKTETSLRFQCIPLYTLLLAIGNPTVNWFILDIEGAEYQVLKEVAASGILCKLKALGNRVVLVVEYHNMSITNAEERRREKDGHRDAVKKLEECGVEFQKLHAHWA